MGKTIWEQTKKTQVVAVVAKTQESARGRMVWREDGIDDDELWQDHSGSFGHGKGCCLYSKNVGYPSEEFKGERGNVKCFLWADFSRFRVENYLAMEATLVFLYLKKYLSFSISNFSKLPFSMFYNVYCFEDVSPAKCVILTNHERKILCVFVILWFLTWAFLPTSELSVGVSMDTALPTMVKTK